MAKQEKTPDSGAPFSKAQLIKMKRYQARMDLLSALLEENGQYTLAQADAKISQFMKGAD